MKKIDLEESLKMAFAYDRVGCADCLHAASPCVLKVEVAVERLREIGRASGR